MTTTEQLRSLLAKATPGKWRYSDHVGDWTAVAIIGDTFIVGPTGSAFADETDDCALIVAAINALPALLNVVEAANNAAHHWQRACQAEPGAGRVADNAMVTLAEALREFKGEGK